MNLHKSHIVLALLGVLGLLVMVLGCSDDASYETNHNNADSDTGKKNNDDTGKPDDSDSGKKNDSDTGKQDGSDTGKKDNSDTGSDTDKPNPPLGTETWLDGATGLEWQVTPPEDGMEAWDGIQYCEGLNLNGHQDWRLPNLSELRSLIRDCPTTETGGECPLTSECVDGDSIACPMTDDEHVACNKGCTTHEGVCYWHSELNGHCGFYWADSPKATSGESNYYIRFNMASFGTSYVTLGREYSVRCVRGG